MTDINEALKRITKILEPTFTQYGIKPIIPEGVKHYELPLIMRDDDALVNYESEKGKLRLLYANDKLHMLLGSTEATSEDDSDYKRILTCLFELGNVEERDFKSVANEIADTIHENFGKKALFTQGSKMPVPVSKAQVKSGESSYDALTLANRILSIYPELKDEYKRNHETYGEFLPEDFFVNHANAYILQTIEENNPQKMKKLFNILNEIYENGTNATQGIIVVTILGSINGNPVLEKNIIEYISDLMLDTFLQISRHLEKSKNAKIRLAHPPIYKPKTKKKGGIMSMLGM